MKLLSVGVLSFFLAGCSSDETLANAMESISEECRSPVVVQLEASIFNKTLTIRCDDMPVKRKESK